VRFATIAKCRHIWPLAWLCQALEVTRGGFYAWSKGPESERARVDVKLTAAIRASFVESDRTSGARRVRRDLRDWGHRCGIHRAERLMRIARLVARPRRRRLPFDQGTRIEHTIAPNVLDRRFEATEPNLKWAADFTYIWTTEGWLYVAVVLDLFSRRVVGWSMSSQMTAQLVTDAMLMPTKALLHHSDQGSQPRTRGHLQHEPSMKLLGQRRDGKLLLDAEDRANAPQPLLDSRRCSSGYL
jgi:putative transposase